VAAALLLLVLLGTKPLSSSESRVAELERAMSRARRPLPAATTLTALERRVQASPEAAAYIRGLRLLRYCGGEPPTARQRRALRAELRAWLGPLGRLRALWALPPRRPSGGRRARRPGRP
jgi:hypothetical protein